MVPIWVYYASLIIFSIMMLMSVGESKQPYLTQLLSETTLQLVLRSKLHYLLYYIGFVSIQLVLE